MRSIFFIHLNVRIDHLVGQATCTLECRSCNMYPHGLAGNYICVCR